MKTNKPNGKTRVQKNEIKKRVLSTKTTPILKSPAPKHLLRNLLDAYILIDFEGNVLELNDATLTLFGYSEFKPFNVKKHTYYKDEHLNQLFFDTILEQGFFKDFEGRMVTTKNEVKWVYLNANIQYDEHKNPQGIQAIIRDITEHKKIYETAQKKENELNIILDNAPIGILLTNGRKIVESNKKIEALLGYSKTELLDKNMLTLTVKEDIPKSQELIDTLERGEAESFQVEKRYIKKDGSILWAKTRLNTSRNSLGKRDFNILLIEDITERTRQQQLLIQQKHELDLILENSPSAYGLTENNYFIKCNLALKALLGYTSAEKGTLSIITLTDKDDVEKLTKNIKNLNSEKQNSFQLELKLIKKNREKIWVKIKASAVQNSLNHNKYIVYIIEDITQQRKEQLVKTIIQNATLPIANKFDIYEIANHLANSISQYLNTNYCTINIINNNTQFIEEVASTQRKPDKQRHPVKTPIKIGHGIIGFVANSGIAEIINDTYKAPRYITEKTTMLSEIVVPVIDHGQVIGIINAKHKNRNHFTKTNLKILQQIAENISLKLKNAIQYRETLVVQKKNQELLKKLKQNNDELKDFAHIVSHDLKSPLRSIDALLHWLKEDFSDYYKNNAYANKVFSNIDIKLEHMENLIDGILKYSSIGITDNTRKHKVDLNLILKNITNIVQIPSHINIHIKKQLPIINACEIRIHQLFLNLISNAIKYNDKPVGLIEIDFKDNGTHWQFGVTDNGKGIPKKYYDKIFDMFQTLDENTNSTGIGLSIVRKIVTLYDGEIWVSSKEGEGSSFYFTIKK